MASSTVLLPSMVRACLWTYRRALHTHLWPSRVLDIPRQDFLQVLSMFAGFNFDWPPTLKAVYNAFSLAAFYLELLAPGTKHAPCIVHGGLGIGAADLHTGRHL